MGNINSYFKSEPKPKPGRPSKESNAGRKSAAPSENLLTGLKPPTAAEKAAAAKANSTARNLASAANKAKSGEMLDAVETAAIIKAAASTAKAPGEKMPNELVAQRERRAHVEGGELVAGVQGAWLFGLATTSTLR